MFTKKRINIYSFLLITLFLAVLLPGKLYADEKIGTITGSIVNVRKGPGTQFARVAKTSEGKFVSILEERNNWYKVKLADGTTGWVAGWLVDQNDDLELAVVTGNVVNIRKGPGTNYLRIDQVKAGDKLTILKKQEDWYKVLLPGGKQGWIAGWLVNVNRVLGVQEGIINGSAVNIRKGPNTTYPLLYQLNKGDQVLVKKEENGWCLIETNQGSGWVASWLIDLPGEKSTRNALVTGTIVNIRTGPGTNYPKVFKVKQGDKVEIIGQKQDWYQIKTPTGQEGWIASWLISLEIGLDNSQPTTPESKPASPLKKVVVTGNIVNIRKGPSLNYPIIDKVKEGTHLDVLKEEGEWLYVKLNSGQAGWIAAWLTVDVNSKPLPQPKNYLNQLKFTLDNERILMFKNLGDVLRISINGLNPSQFQVGRADGIRLNIKLNSLNLRPIKQPVDNWGVKEVNITEQNISILFDKKFEFESKYNNNSQSLEIDVNYPAEQLIPVNKIKFNPQETQAVVQIASGRRIDSYQALEVEQNRLVIDLPDTKLQLTSKEEAEQNVAFGPIRKVSSRQLSPDLVRVEAELVPGAEYVVQQNGEYIVVGAKLKTGSLAGKTIVIDPGHGSIQPGGWTDPGAIGKYLGIKERDVNLDVALKLRDLLTQNGAKVVMTHSTGQTYLSLAGRADVANKLNADIFVSIHANSNPNRAMSGTSVYYYAPTWHSELSSQRWLRQRLAFSIQKELVKAGGRRDLGILEESFAVLRETKVPSVLVEMAFLSNIEEERLLATDNFRSKMAWGILKGIQEYFASL